MAPSASWSQPVSGFGFARDVSLSSFASGVASVSGLGYLVTGSYQPGDIYIFDGSILNPTLISPSSDPAPAPIIFGDWVYYLLSGQLPTAQVNGGVTYEGGAYGGISWAPIAFTGNFGLEIQTQSGGILGFDSTIPSLSYTVNGTEVFSAEFQVLDFIPQEITVQLYDSTSRIWRGAYLGTSELFGINAVNTGLIAPLIGGWQAINFTPAQIGMPVGHTITGAAWGVWNSVNPSSVVFSNTTNLNLITSTVVPSGYIDCSQDGNVGYYILSHFGPLVHVSAAGAPPNFVSLFNTPSFVYTGLVYNTAQASPYFIGYDGTLYNYSATFNQVFTIASPVSGLSVPARWLYTDNSNANLYTMYSNSFDIAKYNISGRTWTVTGVPFTKTFDTFSYSSSISGLVAGGSNYQSLTVGSGSIIDMAYSSVSTAPSGQLLVLTNSPTNLNVYNITSGGLSLAQSVSGLSANPIHIATEADGVQALVTDTTNNKINVVTNSGGLWNVSSTVTLTAPTALTIITSGITQALICQPSQNTVSVLNKSGITWGPAAAQTLVVSGATSIAVTTSGVTVSGITATSSGVTFLNFNGAAWTVGSSLSITPAPTIVAADSVTTVNNGLFYSAATSGSTTKINIFQKSLLVGQYTVSNETLGTMIPINWEIIESTAGGNFNIGYYVNGIINNISIQSIAPTNPVKAVYASSVIDFEPLLFIANASTIWSFYNLSPQSYNRVTDSQVAVLTGLSWNTIDVQNRNTISSITTDVSGNIFAILTDDYLYKWNSAGVLASGYPFIVQPPPNQQTGVPLGLSKLVYWRNKLYSASSLAGGIVTIIP